MAPFPVSLRLALCLSAAYAFQAPKARRAPFVRHAVVEIKSESELEDAWAQGKAADKIVAVKYYATWCKACKTIEPRFRRMADEYTDAGTFYQVEFTANKELCRRMDVQKLPCVQFFKGADLVDTLLCGPKKFDEVRTRMSGLAGGAVAPTDAANTESLDIDADGE
ncbi:thioredoxin-like protein [Pelagophyceae sp. CCMP2097]|nr:thioredoxin-like protein [Pelagophyceae sp. CCMP2097]